ncbi:MAG: hypothetical protein JETT_3099 [Candidatus Jettenia ecosi]|uniref:HNH endonuclease n=1 Tax=Candidatus Jettenia ecosi TaxID=2494326 RepID=A0A533Q7M0_9BACT|nr:MAG: hypothetical protein JETT_3099 [Candidatus Jettenia ecosi]
MKIEGRIQGAGKAPEVFEKLNVIKTFLENNPGKLFAYLVKNNAPIDCKYLFVRRSESKIKDPFIAIYKIKKVIHREEVTSDMRPPVSKHFPDYRYAEEPKALLISHIAITNIDFKKIRKLDGTELVSVNPMTKAKIVDEELINLIKRWDRESLTESNRGLIEELDEKYSHTPEFEEKVVKQIQRPSDLRIAILDARGTKCQLCEYPGFTKKDGGIYAETHHMIELNKQATKTLQSWNVLVLCPTCHMKMHYAKVHYEPFGKGWRIILDGEDRII